MEGEKMAYKMMNQDFVKLDKFDGSNFIRWQDKMKFLLTALKIFYVLDPNLQPIPDPTPQDTEQLKQQRIKREEDELVCKGHILNTLSDRLYDLFTTMTSPKEIWKALETKYKTEKQGHYIRECRFLKNQMKEKELNTSETNVVDEIVAMVSEMQIGMITEVHMANTVENSSEWWYDSGATIHVCNNKMLFKEYVEAGNGLEVLMGNHNTA
uniref:Retrovirus-related Pol polyprotein from transposon TNT 1-94-like beta-barrel domain-containing protein n=1 Tax=Fagus sylvatica TaxID=28930 RepID=A0A2N9HT24_FAGSY